MAYDAIIEALRSNHFYPGRLTKETKAGPKCIGVYINCPPILADLRLNRVRELLPEGYKADFISNKQEIHISLDKKST